MFAPDPKRDFNQEYYALHGELPYSNNKWIVVGNAQKEMFLASRKSLHQDDNFCSHNSVDWQTKVAGIMMLLCLPLVINLLPLFIILGIINMFNNKK